MDEHHPTLAPSSMPMLNRCQLFEREQDVVSKMDKYRDKGTKLHVAFANLLMGKDSGVALLPDEAEQVDWAVDYVRSTASDEYPLEVEQRLELRDSSFKVITFGKADVLNGNNHWMADLKTLGTHDYWYQMAAYAAMKMQRDGGGLVAVDVLYSMTKQVERYVIGAMEAKEALSVLFEKMRNPHKVPQPNEFCKWCKHLLTCPAVQDRRLAVISAKGWTPTSFDPLKELTPADMGKAVAIAKLLEDWCEQILTKAKQMAEAGQVPVGYRLKAKAGNSYVTDVFTAFKRSGLPQEEFNKCLSVTIGKIAEQISLIENVPVSVARKITHERLGDVISRHAPSSQLEIVKLK